jgi:DNA-binding MarR family transcriptional regulator
MTPDAPRAGAQTDTTAISSSSPADPMSEHIDWAVSTWPQIDPDVEGIVSRVDKIGRYLQNAFRASLGQAGLTKEEWKVIMALSRGVRSHGWLCRDLDVSTGAMTNRLDKLEREGLVSRARDPNDRRGVLLSLTAAGSERLDAYIDRGAHRERQLLEGLTQTDKRRLNDLLAKLIDSLRAEQAG